MITPNSLLDRLNSVKSLPSPPVGSIKKDKSGSLKLPLLDDSRNIHLTSHKFLIFGGIVASVIIIFLSVSLAINRTSWWSHAETSSTSTLSLENSYAFASPIAAVSDGRSIVRITIFAISRQGLGIAGKKVTLKVSKQVKISEVQSVTDTLGRAIFDATSTNPGDYTAAVEIGGAVLSQKVSMSFR